LLGVKYSFSLSIERLQPLTNNLDGYFNFFDRIPCILLSDRYMEVVEIRLPMEAHDLNQIIEIVKAVPLHYLPSLGGVAIFLASFGA
jgi:hypothetical protein